jgi:hypothetical protein
MTPAEQYPIYAHAQDDANDSSSVEDMKNFHHSRNKTGVLGHAAWHPDSEVNELWTKLSVPEPSGNTKG